MSVIPDSPLAGAVKELPDDGIESMKPVVCVGGEQQKPIGRIQRGDYVIFSNLRGEREIELTQAFVDREFEGFEREFLSTHWVTMVRYDASLDASVAYGPGDEGKEAPDDRGEIKDTLSETIGEAGLRQVKISEVGKRHHVGFFLNGRTHESFAGETPHPPVECSDEKHSSPEMCAYEVADAAIAALNDDELSLVVVNFGNVDVIGHKGCAKEAMRAVSAVDSQLGRAIWAAKKAGVVSVVTADHGTVEKWFYPSDKEEGDDGQKEVDDGHTNSPVPFVLVPPLLSTSRNAGEEYLSQRLENAVLRDGGSLIDVAPTVLQLLGLDRPKVMKGTSLIEGEIELEGLDHPRVALFILDGWGVGDKSEGDLIEQSDTPVMDALQMDYPSTCLDAAGEAVGLPPDMGDREGPWVGNSEVGHLHIGAGRVIESDRVRINQEIKEGTFFQNEVLREAMLGAKRDGTRLHLLGIVSMYSSHGSLLYLDALLEMAKSIDVPEVYIHGIMTKRGERRRDIDSYVGKIEADCRELGVGQLVGLIGRKLALDREDNWDRIEKTYRWLVYGEGTSVQCV